MRALLKLAALAAAAFLAFSTPSYASNPLIGGSSHPTVLSDKELDGVKGSGYYATLYGYYGYLYAYDAYYNAYYGYYYASYGITGPNSNTTNLLYNAYLYSTYATYYLYYAYYFSYYNE